MNSTVMLRQITILAFPLELVLFIVHGAGSRLAFPATGLVPLAGSAALGLVLLHRDRVAGMGSPVHALSASNVFFADTLLAVALFFCLILTCVFLGHTARTEMVILGAYCSVILMGSFGIHFYFAAAEALHIVTSRTSPFKSLAADYTPFTSDYADDPENVEQESTIT